MKLRELWALTISEIHVDLCEYEGFDLCPLHESYRFEANGDVYREDNGFDWKLEPEEWSFLFNLEVAEIMPASCGKKNWLNVSVV